MSGRLSATGSLAITLAVVIIPPATVLVVLGLLALPFAFHSGLATAVDLVGLSLILLVLVVARSVLRRAVRG